MIHHPVQTLDFYRSYVARNRPVVIQGQSRLAMLSQSAALHALANFTMKALQGPWRTGLPCRSGRQLNTWPQSCRDGRCACLAG